MVVRWKTGWYITKYEKWKLLTNVGNFFFVNQLLELSSTSSLNLNKLSLEQFKTNKIKQKNKAFRLKRIKSSVKVIILTPSNPLFLFERLFWLLALITRPYFRFTQPLQTLYLWGFRGNKKSARRGLNPHRARVVSQRDNINLQTRKVWIIVCKFLW